VFVFVVCVGGCVGLGVCGCGVCVCVCVCGVYGSSKCAYFLLY